MKGRGDRPTRVAERIREEIALILQNRVKDPGMRLVTVTEVTVTPDLKSARIGYSVLGSDLDRAAAGEALARSRGFIRRELGAALGIRYAPDIVFLYDDGYERGARIGRLLKDAEGVGGEE